MPNIAIISGSPSASSRLNGIVEGLQAELLEAGAAVQIITLRELPPEDLIYTKFDSPFITKALGEIEKADAVVVATPIYKASYTGVVKCFLDMIPQKGLLGKATLPVVIGGTIGHLLVIDYALKPVLAAIGAKHQLQGIFAQDTQVARNEDGSFQLADELTERIQNSVKELIHDLHLYKNN
ncbi:NADPH-dependent FMN reductase [Brevibacillus sp. NRS-1366]|uniref:NADPH-dependent FMN reductase n=1 Tax=Brevibacillus sp. NRS-1366 TaxID=3233899 RepID=UPI003D20610D